jgi:hypothetical protein
MSPVNKCHKCGATTYAQVIERDASDAMRPTGMHRCAGCKLLFTSIHEWRTGQPEPMQPPSTGAGPSVTVAPG